MGDLVFLKCQKPSLLDPKGSGEEDGPPDGDGEGAQGADEEHPSPPSVSESAVQILKNPGSNKTRGNSANSGRNIEDPRAPDQFVGAIPAA